MTELVHFVSLFASALVAGFAFTRAKSRTGGKRWAVLALASYATSSVLAQMTLFHAPVTVRTWASLVAALVGVVYIAVTARIKE